MEALDSQKGEYGTLYRTEGQLYGRPGDEYWIVGVAQQGYNGPEAEHVVRLTDDSYNAILGKTAPSQVSLRFWLFVFYVLAFAGAASSLVWLGVIEYLQGELQIQDADLIRTPYRRAKTSTPQGS
jgi:hypothetical protein